MEPIRVVAAVIQRDGKILACRRAPHKSLAGLWEFPGGKVEPGETDEVALAREILEELSVSVLIGSFIGMALAKVEDQRIELFAYHAELQGEEIVSSKDHDKIWWLKVGELQSLDMGSADTAIIRFISNFDQSRV